MIERSKILRLQATAYRNAASIAELTLIAEDRTGPAYVARDTRDRIVARIHAQALHLEREAEVAERAENRASNGLLLWLLGIVGSIVLIITIVGQII